MEVLRAQDPRRVGRYQLLARLGSGGMGRVFLGQSPGGRLVAVKLIRAELAENPDFRARFAREVAAARRVSGIYTAPVVDADPDGPQPWLVTAYVEGKSLADAVADQGRLPAAAVLTLAAGLAEGLDAIHAAGVVHRDLKPSNVVLAADGPRIIDFGISRAVDTAAAVTHAGWVAGSPGFMSPEQAEGHRVGPPSDIFSLGSVLTFAATGDGPFGTGPPTAMLYRVVHCTPNLGGMPEQLRRLVERCLAKDPGQRPTAEQVLAWPGLLAPVAEWLPGPDQMRSLTPDAFRRATGAAAWSGSAADGWPSQAQDRGSHASQDVAAPPDAEPPETGLMPDRSAASGMSRPASLGQAAAPVQPTSLDQPVTSSHGEHAASRSHTAGRHQAGGRRHPSHLARRSRGRARLISVLAAVVAIAAATTAAVEVHGSRHAPPANPNPRTIVREYFAAINARDWLEVWRLGGRNFSPSLHAMIAGYSTTSRDVLADLNVDGDIVRVRLVAYQTTGAVQLYELIYWVKRGMITAGRQSLVSTGHPAA